MIVAIVATLAVAAGVGLASRPDVAGTPQMFLFVGAPYAVLGGLALTRLVRTGELADRLRPQPGDITFGAVVAALLYAAALVGRMLLAPHGSAREDWLMRVYFQIGEPALVQQRMAILTPALALIAALEELTWRDLVFRSLESWRGTRAAYPLTAVLYGLSQLPTVWLLRGFEAGPNPLVVLAATGAGLVWGVVVARTGRLPVAILSHALFTASVIVWFPLWRLG